MAITLTEDMLLAIGAIIVAAVAIFMFMKATDGVSKPVKKPDESESTVRQFSYQPSSIATPSLPIITEKLEVDKARTSIRTLTLQQEILGMVMKRLFEAEDEGQINKGERERLSQNYEGELQKVTEQLNKAELIVSLNELEEIRIDIIQQFQATLTDTQSKIDLIIKELNIQQIEPEPKEETKQEPTPLMRRVRPRPQPQQEEPDEEPEGDDSEDDDPETTRRGRETVEDRLDKLKQDVLKELEELDRLELEQ
jgi:hypothetical protein